MTALEHREIFSRTLRHFLAPLEPLLQDESVSEIMVNGHDQVYVERAGKIDKVSAAFSSDAALMAAVRNIAEYVNREIDHRHHSMDARLPDGSRVHAIIAPASRQGTCLTIRRFQKANFDLQALVAKDSLSAAAAEFLGICVALHKNIVVSGATGTGKTSFLNALSAEISPTERIIVIEDSSELQLRQPHALYFESQPADPDGVGAVSIRDLFVDSLRMRPDRIVVGEVRRGEALDLIQSMISGHAGSLTTVHASGPRAAASRLETLCLMSDTTLPQAVARTQVATAVNLVVQLVRLADGSRRVSEISECLGLDPQGEYQWRSLFRFTANGVSEEGRVLGHLHPTGNLPTFSDEPWQFGLGERVDLSRDLFQK